MFSDNEDEAVQYLRQIAANTGSLDIDVEEGDTIVNTGPDLSRPTDDNTANQWFTTGDSPVALPAEDDPNWERVEFGFVARAIHIRFTGPVQFCPNNPQNNVASALPGPNTEWGGYELGGSPPIGTAFLWVRAAPEAEEDVGIMLEAY